MQPTADAYAVRFLVDYPERELNRLTTFFRVFVAIPIFVVVVAVSGGGSATWDHNGRASRSRAACCSSPRC